MDILSLTAVELAKAIREGMFANKDARLYGTVIYPRRPFWIRSQPVKIPTTAM